MLVVLEHVCYQFYFDHYNHQRTNHKKGGVGSASSPGEIIAISTSTISVKKYHNQRTTNQPTMRNNAPVTSRILTTIVATFHLVIGLGIGWGVGPVEYDPAAFIVAGQPGKWQPGGLEILFPRILGCLYVSIANNSPVAIDT